MRGWGSAGQQVTVKYSCLTVGNQQCGDWEEVGCVQLPGELGNSAGPLGMLGCGQAKPTENSWSLLNAIIVPSSPLCFRKIFVLNFLLIFVSVVMHFRSENIFWESVLPCNHVGTGEELKCQAW